MYRRWDHPNSRYPRDPEINWSHVGPHGRMDLSPVSPFLSQDGEMVPTPHVIRRHEIDLGLSSPNIRVPYTPPRHIHNTAANYQEQVAFNTTRIHARRPFFDLLLSSSKVSASEYDILCCIDPRKTIQRTTLIINLYAQHRLSAAEYDSIK